MANAYRVVTQYPTVEFLGGAATRPVMAVGYVTKPSGVYFEHRIPQASYSPHEVDVQGDGHAAAIEDQLKSPHVSGLTWQQNAKPDGTLADQAEIYVTSASGDSSASFVVPFDWLGTAPVDQQAAALAAQLDAAEGL